MPTHAALQDQSPKLAQLTFDLCITIVTVQTFSKEKTGKPLRLVCTVKKIK